MLARLSVWLVMREDIRRVTVGMLTLLRLPVELFVVFIGVVFTCSSGKGCTAQGSCFSKSSTTDLLSLLPKIDLTSAL